MSNPKVSYSILIIAFPDLTGISQDANNVALFEAEKSVNLGSGSS